MKTTLFLSLALALPMISSCGDAADAASKAGENASAAAKGAMDSAAERFKNMDLSSMTPAAMKEQGSEMLSTVTEKLGSIKDAATAENFKEKYGNAVDKLSQIKETIGAKLPGTEALKTAVDKLKASFGEDSKVMEILQPLMDKMSSLFS